MAEVSPKSTRTGRTVKVPARLREPTKTLNLPGETEANELLDEPTSDAFATLLSDMSTREKSEFDLPPNVRDSAHKDTAKRKLLSPEELDRILKGYQQSLTQQIEHAAEAGASCRDTDRTRLVDLAKPSATIFEGLVSNEEPSDAPDVASFLPPILVQYLAWQRLCQLNGDRKRAKLEETGPVALLKDSNGGECRVTKLKPALIGRKAQFFEPDIDAGDNKLISKKHARVQFEEDTLVLKSLGKNATVVDGAAVPGQAAAILNHKSTIEISGFKVNVILE